MKKILVLLLGLFFCKAGFAQKGQQTFGLIIGSELTPGITNDFMEREPTLSYSGGVYYDLNISRRFGFNVAPGQRISSQGFQNWDMCLGCSGLPDWQVYSFHTIEVPVNLTLNLNSKETAKWKSYFTIGYTYSYLFLIRNKDSGDFINVNDLFFMLDRDGHYANVGFEVRHNFSENYTLSINPFSRLQYDFEFNNPTFGLNFKIGRIL